MTYRVLVRDRVMKQIERLPSDIRSEVRETLVALQENPLPHGSKKMHGYKNCFRIKVGRQYRIVYEVVKHVCIITVIKVGDRKDVYRML